MTLYYPSPTLRSLNISSLSRLPPSYIFMKMQQNNCRRQSRLTVRFRSSSPNILISLLSFLLEMTPYYKIVTSSSALKSDAALLEQMEKTNKEELEKLDQRLAEAQKTEGESEISDALKARANYLTKIGEKVCLLLLNFLSRCIRSNNIFVYVRSGQWRPRNSH